MTGKDREGRTARTPAVLRAAVAGLLTAAVLGGGWVLLEQAPLADEPFAIVPIPQAPAETAPGGPRAAAMPDGAVADAVAEAPTDGPSALAVEVPAAPAPDEVRLARAPIPALTEDSPFGPLPRIADDGRMPAVTYARAWSGPVPSGPEAPVRIALLVGGLGVSASGTSDAIHRLPRPVGLGFSPYGTDLQTWVDRARGGGHEVMLEVPMEPFDYPDSDPGPEALMADLPFARNRDRLHWALGRFVGYFGVTNAMGAKFTAAPDALGPVLGEIAARGLAYLDDGASPRSQVLDLAPAGGPPVLRADIYIDAASDRQTIAAALARLEAVAKDKGRSVAVAGAAPLVVDMLAEWAEGLASRAIELVPVSAIPERRQG